MLLFPFLSGLALARAAGWESVAALAACLTVFLAQEPILILARQRFIWRERHPETFDAAFTLALLTAIGGICGVFLALRLDLRILAAMGFVAAALIGLRTALALENKQRSAFLQLVAACGLSGTVMLAYYSAREEFHTEAFVLWAAFSAHHCAALLVVRARLEAIIAFKSKRNLVPRFGFAAWAAQAVLTVFAVWALVTGWVLLALAFAVPIALHSRDLLTLNQPRAVQTPMMRVGFREMAISAAFSALSIASFALL